MSYPILKFRYAYPLDNRFRVYEEKLNPGVPYPSIDEVRERVPLLPAVWDEINKNNKAFKALEEIIGGVPQEERLTVYVVGRIGAMSTPLTVSTHRKGDGKPMPSETMQEIMLHELCHVCLTTLRGPRNVFWPAYLERYKNEKKVIVNHVLIYAFLLKIFEKLELGEERTEKMLQHPNLDYQRAIDLMRERGADALLQEYRDNIPIS